MGMNVIAVGEGVAMSQAPSKPVIVILLGPPGAGKGTHASLLSEHLGLPHISTGDLFRSAVRSESPLGKKVQKFIDQGQLVPDEIVLDMLFQRLKESDCAQGCILDGCPRTVAQAKILDGKLKKHNRIIVLHFHIPDSILIERVIGRLVCKDCKRPYHETLDPPEEAGLCDLCGGELLSRSDDRERIMIERLAIYHVQAKPLIDYYAAQKEVLREIDGHNAKNQVFQDVLEALPLKGLVKAR